MATPFGQGDWAPPSGPPMAPPPPPPVSLAPPAAPPSTSSPGFSPPAAPGPSPARPGRGRGRWGLALGAAAALVVAAVVATRLSGGSDGSGGDAAGGGGDAWVSTERGNSLLLATDGEVACSTSLSSTVYCVDAASGEERFSQQLDEGITTSPVLAGDRLLVASARALSGNMRAYSLDGGELWNVSLEVSAERDLPVTGGVVAVADDRQLVGLDVATGEERWRLFTGEELEDPHVTGAETFTDGTRFYAALELLDTESGDSAGHVVAFEPATGTELWRSPLFPELSFGAGILAAAPFADGSAVAFMLNGEPGRVVVLDTATGQLRWEVALTSVYASVAHLDGTTFVADGADMRAYDPAGGEVWAVRAPVLERSPDLLSPGELVVDQGRVFAAGYHVFEVDPADGTSRLVRERVSATDVAIAGDLLLIAGISQLEAVPL